MHEINVVGFLANLTVILLSAKIFGELAERLGQPAVLGELLGGVVLGFGFIGFFNPHDPAFKPIQPMPPPVRPESIR
jgi:Kef-type K+ transport system membrane component KefB